MMADTIARPCDKSFAVRPQWTPTAAGETSRVMPHAVHVTVYFVFSGISGTKKREILSTCFCTGWATWLSQRGQVRGVVARWVAFQPHPKMKNTRVRLPRVCPHSRPASPYAAIMRPRLRS